MRGPINVLCTAPRERQQYHILLLLLLYLEATCTDDRLHIDNAAATIMDMTCTGVLLIYKGYY